jgi:hypothetical protein
MSDDVAGGARRHQLQMLERGRSVEARAMSPRREERSQ